MSHADLLLAAEALDEANAQNVAAVGAQVADCTAQLRAIAFDPDRCPNPGERNDAATDEAALLLPGSQALAEAGGTGHLSFAWRLAVCSREHLPGHLCHLWIALPGR